VAWHHRIIVLVLAVKLSDKCTVVCRLLTAAYWFQVVFGYLFPSYASLGPGPHKRRVGFVQDRRGPVRAPGP